MLQDLEVSQSIAVNAGTAGVWDALTNPEIIKEYLFGTETVTDWKPGSEIIFQGSYDTHTYKDKGIVLQNDPEKLLSYSYWSAFSGLEDKPENYATITYTVTGDDHRSTFTWTQKGYADQDRYEHSKDGMAAFMESIKQVMEKQ